MFVMKSQKRCEKVYCMYADNVCDEDDDDEGHVDKLSENKNIISDETTKNNIKPNEEEVRKNVRHSPSDVLEDLVELPPPFTSRYLRGIAHEGVLEIGNNIISKEKLRFDEYVNNLKEECDSAWSYIQEREKGIVDRKVTEMYNNIFLKKKQIMQEEMNKFFEQSLQELETHLRDEMDTVLIKTRAAITTALNIEIQKRLKAHKANLNKILQQEYENEIAKLKKYYEIKLNNEKNKINMAISRALYDRNDTLKAFCRELEAEKFTSTMYVMCMERKKCKIRHFHLENYHNKETKDILETIKDKQDFLEQNSKQTISQLNLEWETKIKKILQLFLKFISFSLRLLPEQTTFLLDLEKIVVLQLNEIQKNPVSTSSVLIDGSELNNTFKFEKYDTEENVCVGEPFVLETGDLPAEIKRDSRATLLSDQDLPFLRVQRQFIYAKCQKIEEVRKLLDLERCKCEAGIICSPIPTVPAHSPLESSLSPRPQSNTTTTPSSDFSETPSFVFSELSIDHSPQSNSDRSSVQEVDEDVSPKKGDKKGPSYHSESSSSKNYSLENIQRLRECTAKTCKKINVNVVLPGDFDEDNFKRAITIMDDSSKEEVLPELLKPKDFLGDTLPFAATKTLYLSEGVQYSEDDLASGVPAPENLCHCKCELSPVQSDIDIDKLMDKRRKSLMKLIHEHPKLLQILTDL